jgi:redox-sensitive bicupin YhaK (pirin superfamily)
MKKVLSIHKAPPPHWVGDGFPVRSLFSYNSGADRLSPFLLLDHAGPRTFEPSEKPRGVGEHPHRGFETVTIVYQGEVAHRDSSGGGGVIGPGDVQWMTAGSGVLHDEFHSENFTRRGGELEMAQLWVDLPAEQKMTTPRYQAIHDRDIPTIELPDRAGTVRVIAGGFLGAVGPAKTFSPVDVWDVRINEGASSVFEFPDGHNVLIAVLDGTVQINNDEIARGGQVAILDRSGDSVVVEANNEAKLLFLSGQPLNQAVVGYGPFVMTSQDEIREAIDDFNSGRFAQSL